MKKKHTIKKTMLTYKTINRFEAEYITNQYTPSEIDGIELAAYTANMNECVHPEWKEDDIFNDFLRVLKIHKIAVIKKKAKNQCSNCKYFTVCGDPERTESCNGRETVKPFILRIYKSSGLIDHEEFFTTKTEMDARYRELFIYEKFGLNPTAWKFENGKLNLLSGY